MFSTIYSFELYSVLIEHIRCLVAVYFAAVSLQLARRLSAEPQSPFSNCLTCSLFIPCSLLYWLSDAADSFSVSHFKDFTRRFKASTAFVNLGLAFGFVA